MIIFARTRYHYDSYTDFWKLVELSGYPIVYVDEIEINNPDNTYIFSPMNGEFQSLIPKTWVPKGHRCTILHWNLERPSGSGGLLFYKESNQRYIDRGWIDAVLVSDRQLAADTGFKYVPLGSHKDLGEFSLHCDKMYDVAVMSCYSPRRAFLFNYPYLKAQDNGLTIAPNCWGQERHEALKASRYMLNIHQDGYQYLEPLRFALAAAYGLPIISESCGSFYPYTNGTLVISEHLLKCEGTGAIKYATRYREDYFGVAARLYLEAVIDGNFKSLLEKHL